MIKEYTKYNFHSHTFCIWKEINKKEIANKTIDYKSKSGSQYIFETQGVYRISNHWGRAANCRWRLQPLLEYKNQTTKIGFANWDHFYNNNNTSKLFYILVDFDTKTVQFHHKDDMKFANITFFNATDVAKRIKIIMQIMLETSWANYLIYDDITKIRHEIVEQLCSTNKNFIEIKKNYIKLV